MGIWDNIKKWYNKTILGKEEIQQEEQQPAKTTKGKEIAKRKETDKLIKESSKEQYSTNIVPLEPKQITKTTKEKELQKTQQTDSLIKEATTSRVLTPEEEKEITETKAALLEGEAKAEKKELGKKRSDRYRAPEGAKPISQINEEVNSQINKSLGNTLAYSGTINGLTYAQYSQAAILSRGTAVDAGIAALIVESATQGGEIKQRFRTRVEVYGNDQLVRIIEYNGETIDKIHPIFAEFWKEMEQYNDGTGSSFNTHIHSTIEEISRRNGSPEPTIYKVSEITGQMRITGVKYYTDFA